MIQIKIYALALQNLFGLRSESKNINLDDRRSYRKW